MVALTAAGLSLGTVFGAAEETSDEKSISSAFESITVSCKVMPDSKGDTVIWKYINHWDFPLVIQRMDAPCGCLSLITKPADEENIIAVEPGETGEIRAIVTPGNHRGTIRKSVYVGFFGHENHVELILEAHIPSLVELSHQELTWQADSKNETQTIEVTSGTGQNFAITNLLGVSENLYTIRQELVVENHYRLHITPAGTLEPGIQILQIRTDSKDPRCQILTVFLRTSKSFSTDKSSNPETSASSRKISE